MRYRSSHLRTPHKPGTLRGAPAVTLMMTTALVATLLTACGRPTPASAGTVSVGLGSNVFEMPIRMAAAKGYFAKQGLKVKFVTLTAANGTSALQSGSVQFLSDSPTDFLSALARDVPETAISVDGVGNPLGLIVSTEFAKAHHLTTATPAAQVAETLAGTTGGASSANTKAETGIFLHAYGVGPDTVHWVSLPTPAADEAALKRHEIDWFTTSEPAPLEIQHSGDGVVVADAHKVPAWSNAKVGYGELIVARTDYLRQHGALATKFATAVQQATAYMNAHLDSTAVQSVAQKALPGVPPGVIKESLQLVDWPADGAMNTTGWNTTLAFTNSLGALPTTVKVGPGDWTNKYVSKRG